MIFPFTTLTLLAFFITLALDKTVYGQRKK